MRARRGARVARRAPERGVEAGRVHIGGHNRAVGDFRRFDGLTQQAHVGAQTRVGDGAAVQLAGVEPGQCRAAATEAAALNRRGEHRARYVEGRAGRVVGVDANPARSADEKLVGGGGSEIGVL